MIFQDRYGTGLLPGNAYCVHVTPSQPSVFVNVTGKTSTGFNVVLTPKDASTTLAGGLFDVSVLA